MRRACKPAPPHMTPPLGTYNPPFEHRHITSNATKPLKNGITDVVNDHFLPITTYYPPPLPVL